MLNTNPIQIFITALPERSSLLQEWVYGNSYEQRCVFVCVSRLIFDHTL